MRNVGIRRSVGRKRPLSLIAGAAALALAAAACGSVATTKSRATTTAGNGGTFELTSTGPFTPDLNPLSPSAPFSMDGIIYEPLMYFSNQTDKYAPWLATGFAWANGGRQLSLTIRSGVKWSNGQPFTPADVIFNFDQLAKKVDLATGTPFTLTSAKASGNTVVLDWSASQYANFNTIVSTVMVPPFTFASVANPLKFSDSHPIGTGPFVLTSQTSSYLKFAKNPSYWQKGLPHVSDLEVVNTESNSANEALLIAHKVYLSGAFSPDIITNFVDRDRSRNIFYSQESGGEVQLYLNLGMKMFDNLALRRAISDALDRQTIVKVGESGSVAVANASGISGAPAAPYVLSKYSHPLTQDLPAARSILSKAGYSMKGGNLYPPGGGSPVAFTLVIPSPFSDWTTDCQFMTSELSQIGIKLTCSGVSIQDWTGDYTTGNYQATLFYGYNNLPGPVFQQLLAVPSSGLPKLGQANNANNIEYYDNPQAVSLLNKIGDYPPTDVSALKPIFAALETIQATQLPSIPLYDNGAKIDYVKGPFHGFPSASDPYWSPFFPNGDWEQIYLHVHL